MRDFLRFLGIADVEFVYAEGLAMGAERQQTALADASNAIRSLTARAPAALAAAA